MDNIRTAIEGLKKMNDEHGAFWVGLVKKEENVLEVHKNLELVGVFEDEPEIEYKGIGKDWDDIEILFQTFLDDKISLVKARLKKGVWRELCSSLTKESMMDSKDQFLITIKDEYLRLTKGQVSEDQVDRVSNAITDYYYEQYQRFRLQYPKSVKRYSTFQLKDLGHPTTFEIIIKTLKENIGVGYEEFTLPFLKMTLEQLRQFEKNREEFYKIF